MCVFVISSQFNGPQVAADYSLYKPYIKMPLNERNIYTHFFFESPPSRTNPTARTHMIKHKCAIVNLSLFEWSVICAIQHTLADVRKWVEEVMIFLSSSCFFLFPSLEPRIYNTVHTVQTRRHSSSTIYIRKNLIFAKFLIHSHLIIIQTEHYIYCNYI